MSCTFSVGVKTGMTLKIGSRRSLMELVQAACSRRVNPAQKQSRICFSYWEH